MAKDKESSVYCQLCGKIIVKKDLRKTTIPVTYGINKPCHPDCVLKYLIKEKVGEEDVRRKTS